MILSSYSDVKESQITRVFAYCRVSTAEQSTDTQVQEIAAAGYEVKPQRAITETIREVNRGHFRAATFRRNGATSVIGFDIADGI